MTQIVKLGLSVSDLLPGDKNIRSHFSDTSPHPSGIARERAFSTSSKFSRSMVPSLRPMA